MRRTVRAVAKPVTRWSLAVGSVVVLGVLAYFSRTYVQEVDMFMGTVAFPLVSVGVLGGVGYYVGRRDPTIEEMVTILQWSGLGLAAMAAVVWWYELLDVIHDHDVPLAISALATLSIGGAMGATVGHYSVRAETTVREAAEARAREEHLERQRETMALVDRTLRHHLLNALNIADAHADVLADHVDEEGEEHLRTVQHQLAEMIATIEDIRDASEALYEQDDLERVDLSEVVRAELEAVDEAHAEAEVQTDDIPDEVVVEANRLLSNVVSNLLHNAVQHNDAETPVVSADVTDDGQRVTVRVRDNGSGFPEEGEALFEMGERGGDSDGSGMGLFLARTVIERLDGRIWVEDDERGTTVAFEIPKTRQVTE